MEPLSLPKDDSLNVRISQLEKEQLYAIAAAIGKTPSQLVRLALGFIIEASPALVAPVASSDASRP